MERSCETRKESKCASEDAISRMPENVITQILECLEIKDAVRTGILSRDWRFKWTMISQLRFDEKFFSKYDERTISRLFHYLKGAVTRFFLYVPSYKKLDVQEVSLWVMLLSSRGLKELTVINMHQRIPLKLPTTYLFACLDLKLLKLTNCCFQMAPDFCVFPNLLTLDFDMVRFESGNIGEFISRCPLLEILKISDNHPTAKVKPIQITKLENLKMLSLPLHHLENRAAITISDIFRLVGFLPNLHELCLSFQQCKSVVDPGNWKLFPTTFPCLKTLTLQSIDFSNNTSFLCALVMIWRGCRNVQTLNITATYNDALSPPVLASLTLNSGTVGKLKLRNVVFASFRGSDYELFLIKSILAGSPLLKTIAIYVNSSRAFGGEHGKLMFATKLVKLHRASPIADVDIYWV